MKISKYAILLSAILAFVLAITGILFVIFGLVYQNYQIDNLANYLLVSGIVLTFLALFFISGLILLRNRFERGCKLLMLGSLLFIIVGIIPLSHIFVSISGTSTGLYILLFSILVYTPFVWLFFYLWKLKKPY